MSLPGPNSFQSRVVRHYSDITPPSFDHVPEMRPYLTEPKAMYVGVPGKMGYLNLEFELGSDGKSVLRNLDRRAPLIVQQELYFDEQLPKLPCVYILSSGGPNVDGDRYLQRIRVGREAMAYVSTGAATKIAMMKYNFSGMEQHLTVEEGGYLEFLPEPTYPCADARYVCRTRAEVHPTATLVYSEIYMSGRKHHGGERFRYDVLSVETRGVRPGGEELFREKFIVRPKLQPVGMVGVMGGYDVFGNVVAMMPAAEAEEVFSRTEAFIDRDTPLMAGVTRLPSQAGLLYKVLGSEPGPVKRAVRDFCSLVRRVVKGVPLPDEFPWR